MSKHGISNDTTVIFYGDKNNWWACYAFWVFQLFGHTNAKVMDGGRKKWFDEAQSYLNQASQHFESLGAAYNLQLAQIALNRTFGLNLMR